MRTQKFKDKWGDTWEKIDDLTVKRIKDGNLGAFTNGEGLVRINK